MDVVASSSSSAAASATYAVDVDGAPPPASDDAKSTVAVVDATEDVKPPGGQAAPPPGPYKEYYRYPISPARGPYFPKNHKYTPEERSVWLLGLEDFLAGIKDHHLTDPEKRPLEKNPKGPQKEKKEAKKAEKAESKRAAKTKDEDGPSTSKAVVVKTPKKSAPARKSLSSSRSSARLSRGTGEKTEDVKNPKKVKDEADEARIRTLPSVVVMDDICDEDEQADEADDETLQNIHNPDPNMDEEAEVDDDDEDFVDQMRQIGGGVGGQGDKRTAKCLPGCIGSTPEELPEFKTEYRPCPCCGVQQQAGALAEHLRRSHDQDNGFQCGVCCFSAKTKRDRRKHREKQHGDREPHPEDVEDVARIAVMREKQGKRKSESSTKAVGAAKRVSGVSEATSSAKKSRKN